MSAFAWKNAGLTYIILEFISRLNYDFSRYLQYLELCSRVVRHSLKEEFRAAAIKRGEQGLKYGAWSNGKQAPNSILVACLILVSFYFLAPVKNISGKE
jgi:hypothetical protein